ncbi:MAG: gliding motility protein GldC [Gallionella sp.]
MRHSTIAIDVQLDHKNHPESIAWKASDSAVQGEQQAKAMMLAFWDGSKKSALHIDLWTKEMMVDEMADFYYQMLVTMADTFSRATAHKEFVDHMKNSAKEFHSKFGELRKAEMKSARNI